MTASATVSRGVRACFLAAFMVASIGGGATVTLASEDAARSDLCLEMAPEALPEGAWEQVVAAVMNGRGIAAGAVPEPCLHGRADSCDHSGHEREAGHHGRRP